MNRIIAIDTDDLVDEEQDEEKGNEDPFNVFPLLFQQHNSDNNF